MKFREHFSILLLAAPLMATAAEPNMRLVEGYRTFDCQTLTPLRAQQEDSYRKSDATLKSNMAAIEPVYRKPALDEWEQKKATQRASFDLVYKEKQCDASPGTDTTQGITRVEPVTAAAPPTPAASGTPVVTGSMGHLGVVLGSVDAMKAKALGLTAPRGAMVVELDSPAPSGGNGLKPLDVVLEIAGQAVTQPADLLSTVQRMRPGYKAPLRIWRDRAEKELLVVIGTAPPALQQPVAPAALPPASASQARVPAAGPPRFCHATLVPIGKPGGIKSAVWELPGPDYDHAAMLRSMASFVAHVRKAQPGVWHDDIPAGKCFAGANHCTASAIRHFGTTQQINQFCHETREQAEVARERLAKGEVLTAIEWTPPAAP